MPCRTVSRRGSLLACFPRVTQLWGDGDGAKLPAGSHMNRLANTAILHLAVGLAVLLLEPITPRAAGCDQALTEPYLKLQSLSDPVVADCGTWRVQIETDRRDWFKGLSLEFVDSSGALPDVGFSIACSIALDRDGRLMSKTFAGRSRCPEALDQNPLMLRAFSMMEAGVAIRIQTPWWEMVRGQRL